MRNNIILIGFMGCGKTSVGVRLSYLLKKAMTDTDKMIERLNEQTVAEIFERYGEGTFRQMETECLQKLLQEPEGQIISVGGGLPIRSENQELLKQLGLVIYLRVTAKTVCERLSGDMSRPLLQGENPEQRVQELLEKRTPIYESIADIVIDVDEKSFDVILSEVVEKMDERSDEPACN